MKDDNVIEHAINQVETFMRWGADIIDVGAESTRPGSSTIQTEEELSRILPVIKAIREVTELPISVDTYKATVADKALEAGADWVNDVWGLRMDPDMASVVAKWDCPVVLMHNRSRPKEVSQEERLGGRFVGVEYKDLLKEVREELLHSVQIALDAGVKRSNIILDPGIGFGKTVEQNLYLLNHLDRIKDLGYPVLLGPSRKSFIGYTLDLPPDQRVEGTAATVAVGIIRGANIVRVHDVKEMVRVARMTDAILRTRV